MNPQYFLSGEHFAEKPVTEAEFIQAERNAGFHSKFGDSHVATSGFSGRGMFGRVVYVEADKPEAKPMDETDQRRSDAQFNLRKLLVRACIALDLDPDNTSWFEVVDMIERIRDIQ